MNNRFKCIRCGYSTDKMSSMKTHCNVKTICPLANLDVDLKNEYYKNICINTCNECNVNYKHYKNYYEHVKKCSRSAENDKLRKELEELKMANKELELKVETLKKENNDIITNSKIEKDDIIANLKKENDEMIKIVNLCKKEPTNLSLDVTRSVPGVTLQKINKFVKNKEYIYLLQIYPYEECIYKLGMSKHMNSRMSGYKSLRIDVILMLNCTDSYLAEKNLLTLLRESFNNRIDLGDEYFSGDVNDMQTCIYNYMINNK